RIIKYRTHIIYISGIYRVPDMYPITSILTSRFRSAHFSPLILRPKFFKKKNYLRTNKTTNILYSKSSLCQETMLSEAVEVLTLTVGKLPVKKEKNKIVPTTPTTTPTVKTLSNKNVPVLSLKTLWMKITLPTTKRLTLEKTVLPLFLNKISLAKILQHPPRTILLRLLRPVTSRL